MCIVGFEVDPKRARIPSGLNIPKGTMLTMTLQATEHCPDCGHEVPAASFDPKRNVCNICFGNPDS
jgi:hypothetical protein